VPFPWDGTTKKRRVMKRKPAVNRELVYRSASGAIALGCPEAAAAAVICFEWLQRPENVLAGCITWQDYRRALSRMRSRSSTTRPAFRSGTRWRQNLPRPPDRTAHALGGLLQRGDRTTLPFTAVRMGKRVRKLRDKLKLPSTLTLDACRHGGMTKLGEAELTDGRALSGVTGRSGLTRATPSARWSQPCRLPGSATRTESPPLEQLVADRAAGKASATDKAGTKFRKGTRTGFRNELADKG
jgi:hypothetical protein